MSNNMLKLLGMAASAANSHSRGGLARATLGMRFANQLSSSSSSSTPAHHSPPPPLPVFSPLRRGVHVSVYDKNADDEAVQQKAVPEEVIQVKSEEEYWEPDPQTGVFGPASELNEETTGLHSSSANATEDSVLEQKAFFRPLEDLEKPPPPP